uniref:5'-3' exonuclease domain-containing protein n=1 Tax=viral metagenome TaxID=1070528 RepID=A0A6C0ELQ8_9ZZZZ
MTETFLLIDTSYTIFYRFFATKRWYSFAHSDDKFDEDYNWSENELFKTMFNKKYFDSFSNFINTHTIQKDHIIFVKDCPRKDIWRNKYYDKYKSNRASNNSIGHFFNTTYKLINDAEHKLIEFDTLEADDCIYLTKQYIQKKHPNSKIIVITSDEDLLQLIDENTLLYNLQNKCLNIKSTGDRKLDLELKIICGDKSDNINPCFSRCGRKTALKLYNNNSLLLDKFRQFPESLNIYSLNKILIDLENIPEDLVKAFNVYIKEINL